MRIGDLDLELAALQLESLFGIKQIFNRRGRRVSSFEQTERLLFEVDNNGANPAVFDAMQARSFRKTVCSVANSSGQLSDRQIHEKHSDLSLEKIQSNLAAAVQLGILKINDGERYRAVQGAGFGASLEWYVAALFVEKLSSVAYWGVEIEGLPNDYDVVVVRENQVGYVECKSGRLSNIAADEIANFVAREQALAPHFSIFFVDGASLDRLRPLAQQISRAIPAHTFESTSHVSVTPSAIEEYRHFFRVAPRNIFVTESSSGEAQSVFREVYEFLTLVCDRPMYFENATAKAKFKA